MFLLILWSRGYKWQLFLLFQTTNGLVWTVTSNCPMTRTRSVYHIPNCHPIRFLRLIIASWVPYHTIELLLHVASRLSLCVRLNNPLGRMRFNLAKLSLKNHVLRLILSKWKSSSALEKHHEQHSRDNHILCKAAIEISHFIFGWKVWRSTGEN